MLSEIAMHIQMLRSAGVNIEYMVPPLYASPSHRDVISTCVGIHLGIAWHTNNIMTCTWQKHPVALGEQRHSVGIY